MTNKHVNIGSHIRKIRKLQQRTLQDVATACGFTKSLLSKIECGHVIPVIETLIKIASALNTNVSALIEEGTNLESVYISAKHEGYEPVVMESGYSIFPLAVELKQKKMQPFIYTARKEDINDKLHSHIGEEFLYILEGILEFQVGETVYVLYPGDSIFFNCIANHRTVGIQTSTVKLLAIFN
jgi:transcriptional regulator with XRE-family HTH domain